MHGFEELLDVVKAFSFPPLPRGNRTAIIHYTGAGCVIGADACQKAGLELAELSPATIEAIKEITPAWHRIRNPIDLWLAIERHGMEAYDVAIEAALSDPQVDGLVVSVFAMSRWESYISDGPTELAEVFDLPRAFGKPVLFCAEGNEGLAREAAAKIEGQGFPVYPQVDKAIFALSYLSRYARLREQYSS